ncbi:MAG: T9SS type A sorting domain-containing protein [Aequorivita sp.]
MKQNLILVGLFFFSVSVFSQNYKPLLDNLNEWHVTVCYSGCHTDVYFTDGDTIVDGKSYKILDGYHYISRTFLLREEVENRKVYLNIVSPDHNEEFLLYDFSLNEGDTFNMKNPISPFPQDGGPFLLDSIVAKPLADGNDYDHFYFSPTSGNTTSIDNAVWVEGTGSLSIINAPGGKPDINGAGHLSCFFKDTEIFYANLDSIEDCIPVHLDIKKNHLQSVVASKQNNSDKCVLSNTKDVKNVTVFDLTGKTLEKINNKGNKSLIVDLSGYQKGMYIIVATGPADSKKVFKIIK